MAWAIQRPKSPDILIDTDKNTPKKVHLLLPKDQEKGGPAGQKHFDIPPARFQVNTANETTPFPPLT